MSEPRGSLVIPSLDRHTILQETVERFLDFPFDDWELIVVDQTAEPCRFLEQLVDRRPEQVRYLRIDTRGLPNARNVGIAAARGSIVLFVDDDVIPDTGFLAAHLAAYSEAGVGGVAGRIVEAIPKPKTLAEGAPIGRVRRIDGRITRGFENTAEMDVDHAPGGNMSWRRKALLDAGGFDRRFGGTAHLEESDVSLRVRALGCRIRFVPQASLTHLSLQTGGCRELDLATWLYWYGHNYMLFARKNLPTAAFPIFLAERLVKLLYTSVRQLRPAYLVRGVTGLLDGWRASRRPAEGL
ncbi:MAG: glycosyltransferase family 2 protein [Gemmatimonadetes bacterium]|nr:glycosyltransferase family 2 protein [Gemmatimonadota bacterium]MBT7859679.1 glycosyltransferase family 2 protein [Gemmatimonadota bacterium]